MAQPKDSVLALRLCDLLVDQPDFLRETVQGAPQRLLEEAIALHMNSDLFERTKGRRGYCNSHRIRQLKAHVGTSLCCCRWTFFKTELFDRY